MSTNFRREIGAHGKYTRGLFRMHQFNKIEQFVFCLPDQSWALHEEPQSNCEQLYQKLGLHYRVVNVCAGEIGTVAAKKYDTEVWITDIGWMMGPWQIIGVQQLCGTHLLFEEAIDYPGRDRVWAIRGFQGYAPWGLGQRFQDAQKLRR